LAGRTLQRLRVSTNASRRVSLELTPVPQLAVLLAVGAVTSFVTVVVVVSVDVYGIYDPTILVSVDVDTSVAVAVEISVSVDVKTSVSVDV
jgi:hypothetical protein